MNPAIIAILAAAVLIYLLLKSHLYLTRKVWGPSFEEEAAAEDREERWWQYERDEFEDEEA